MANTLLTVEQERQHGAGRGTEAGGGGGRGVALVPLVRADNTRVSEKMPVHFRPRTRR